MRLVDHVRLADWKKRPIPAHVSAESGFYVRRNGSQKVAFQSSLERSFVQMCDFANEVTELRWEPFTIQFEDLIDGKERRYTPDYLLEFTSSTGTRVTRIVEVKPEAEIDRIWRGDPYGVDARRHVAMMAWCNEQIATRFVLASEKLMAAKGLANMLAIADRSTFLVAEMTRTRLLEAAEIPSSLPLDRFVDFGSSYGISRSETISSLLRMCADDELWFDVTRPFDDETVFARGPRRRVF